MRQIKHRNAKRAVEFFTLSAGFKQPYKVLVDGNFLHTALGFRMDDLQKRLSDLLQATSKKGVKLFVTSCILHELQGLGDEFTDTAQWANNQAIPLECRHHKQALQPDECLKQILGEDNAQHYFVATQDKDLRDSLGQMLGGATLFLSVNGIHIAQPTKAQKALAEQDVVVNMLPSQRELRSGSMSKFSETQPLRTSSKFRKHRKRGPNPLSVKPAAGTKKKRPGPRLREALKAAAASKTSGHDSSIKTSSDKDDSCKRKSKKRRRRISADQSKESA